MYTLASRPLRAPAAYPGQCLAFLVLLAPVVDAQTDLGTGCHRCSPKVLLPRGLPLPFFFSRQEKEPTFLRQYSSQGTIAALVPAGSRAVCADRYQRDLFITGFDRAASGGGC